MGRLGDVVFWALWVSASLVLYLVALALIGDWMRDGRSCARGTSCWYDSLEQGSPAGYRFGVSHAAELIIGFICVWIGAMIAIALYGRVTGPHRPSS